MRYQDTSAKVAEYHNQIGELRGKIRELRQSTAPEPVIDYEFASADGPVRLSRLFGDKDHLFVIHNMGATCPYCTLWADGFNGILPHLEDRAAFVVSTPDSPAQQQKFKNSRGWKFRMVSHQGTDFADKMGYKGETGWKPGFSVFKKVDGRVVRVSDTAMGPGDDFCSLWHFFDMMPEGAAGWRPRFAY
jgi:predicted dithiol-disulfide oxidoreductase (DUF899 family)